MNSRLIAIKITRRTAAAAIFFGRDLHYTEVRHLATNPSQAQNSLVGFILSLIEHFRIDSATSPLSEKDNGAQALMVAILTLLRDKAIPHWAIKKSELFEAYGEVPLKRTAAELRRVVRSYWPHIIDEHDEGTCLDAAALGLYLQTERLLSNNSSSHP
jgi:hypothetical protein